MAWPRDALVVASGANPNGLIGGSGRIGQKHQIAALMDMMAPLYLKRPAIGHGNSDGFRPLRAAPDAARKAA